MRSDSRESRTEAEVKKAASAHLHAKDVATALSHFTKDVVAVSNDRLFPCYESLADDVREYYSVLKEVNYATWEDAHVRVVNEDTAVFTARFRYGFTDVHDRAADLRGIWTALFVREQGKWKIRVRHESFSES